MILTKTGQQHGRSTGSRSNFLLLFSLTNCIRLEITLPGTQHFEKANQSPINSNIMHIPFIYHPIKNWKNEPDKHILVPVQEPPHNTNEGSEFLDDAIRTEDQPLIYTEENVAAGSPQNLL
jgi:hypothetical protein